MSAQFQELDWQQTAMGDLTLRRRTDTALGVEAYEVKLGEEFLMSSLFTVAEQELAALGLAATRGNDSVVLVGGLGLGYTALTALRDPRVTARTVIDALPAVIDGHRRELLPTSPGIVRDARTHLVLDDFFARMRRTSLVWCDAILLDVDHTPRHQLDPSHADLYEVAGLRALGTHLRSHGIFALWSDDPPGAEFMAKLAEVFDECVAHVMDFANALTGGTSSNTVYVARVR